MALQQWAIPQLSKILPLDKETLSQIIDYTDTLDKAAAAEHLKNLLGDSPQALEFITSFNARRQEPAKSPANASSTGPISEAPRTKHKPKTKAPLNKLPPPRRPDDYGSTAGGYVKPQLDDYMSTGSRSHGSSSTKASKLALSEQMHPVLKSKPDVIVSAEPTREQPHSSASKPAPRPAGRLISDARSRDSSPAKGKTKINLTGGVPMHGQSEVLNDLDSAIRALEIQTNPSLAPDAKENARRKCNCMAQRHPLLDAAPNCTHCGKVICIKEGLGPCTFCGRPLLSQHEIQSMMRVLREERGQERQSANNATHKKADVAVMPRAFTAPRTGTPLSSAPTSDSEAETRLSAAKIHRDKLLAFQAQNAKRTRIHDEAADFETPDSGTNMWATPQERALQLKKQQKMLREQEWHAQPEYEKRRMVASIDLVGGKVVRRMQKVERAQTPESEDEPPEPEYNTKPQGHEGAFSRNPLLGAGLVRPIARVEESNGKEPAKPKSTWRRVQDDNHDNEQWILDGGLMGASLGGMVEKSQEPAI